MKNFRKSIGVLILSLLFVFLGVAQVSKKTVDKLEDLIDKNQMSEKYWAFWNEEEQAKIDANIEKYRKSDGEITIEGIKPGAEVQIEQISHAFIFGSNIFLFGQFDTAEKNKRYEDAFGDLFNAATVPFYWKTLEPEKGKPRYEAGSSYEYRRPPTDPVVAFCESKGINMNGHAIIYGMRRWGHPEWMPNDRKAMEPIFEAHVKELAARYKDRIQRWDVVNESIDQANRGLMPDDYTYKTYQWAMQYFPENVLFNTNDCDMHGGPSRRYVEIIRDLIDRGIRVDHVGVQMHIFNPKEAGQIAEGADILTPTKLYAVLDCLTEAERPIHISEVTISAVDESPNCEAVQAIITRNLYRLWFSYPTAMGITWWNLADGGAAPGEPSLSGMFTTEIQPKKVYEVMNRLINHEWKTKLTLKADKDGKVTFRGFKGQYRVSWKDKSGKQKQAEFFLKQDGDSIKF